MLAFLFRLETQDGTPAEPGELRDEDGDAPPVLVVEETT